MPQPYQVSQHEQWLKSTSKEDGGCKLRQDVVSSTNNSYMHDQGPVACFTKDRYRSQLFVPDYSWLTCKRESLHSARKVHPEWAIWNATNLLLDPKSQSYQLEIATLKLPAAGRDKFVTESQRRGTPPLQCTPRAHRATTPPLHH